MASKLSVGLILEDEQFRQKLAEDAKEVQGMGNQTSSANQSLARMAQTLVNMTQKSSNYAKQTKQLTNMVIDLKANYKALSDEEKNSDFGKGIAQAIEEVSKKAAEFQDIAADTRAEIKAMASDTASWDAMKQGIDITKNAMEAYTTVASMCGIEQDKLEKVIKKVVAIETVAKTVISIGNALQKQSAVIVGVRKAQEAAAAIAIKLKTAAETKSIVATKAATIAQRLFNAAAKANPYVLLATAIIGVATALIGFTSNADKATDSEEALAKQAEKARENEEKFHKELTREKEGIGEVVSKFTILTARYKELKSVAEKTQFIKDNKREFDELGIAVNSVADAEMAFINKNQEMIKAFTLRIRLANLYKKAAEQMQAAEDQRSIENGTQGNGSLPNGKYNLNDMGYKSTEKQILDVTAELERLQKELGIFSRSSSSKSSTSTDSTKNAIKSAEEAYAKTLENLKSRLEDNAISSSDYSKELNSAREALAKVIANNYTDASSEQKEALKELTKNIEEYSKTLKDINEQTKAVEEAQKKYDSVMNPSTSRITAKDYEGNVNLGNEGDVNKLKEYLKSLDDIEGKLKTLEEQKTKLENTNATASTVYSDITKEVEKLNKEFENTNRLAEQLSNTLTLNDLKDTLKGTRKELAKSIYEGFANATNSVFSFADGIKSLNEQWNNMSEWERFKGVFTQIFSGVDAILNIASAIQTVIEIVNTLKAVRAAASAAEASATATETTALGAKTAAVTAEAAAETAAITSTAAAKVAADTAVIPTALAASTAMQMQTATENTAAYASIPFVGVSLAAAAQAAYEGLWAMAAIPMFAKGGILGGNTTIGDSTLFLGNKGEMVLNSRQQAHLFDLLNHGASDAIMNGQVEFKIKGDTLWGVLDNRARKKSRI